MRGALALAISACATIVHAQRDTSRARPLDPVVVTAERAPTALSATPTPITRIAAATLRATPHAGLADLLRLAPGVSLVDFDGSGRDPQLIVRGFYGGGEAEYVIVLVNGQPVNQLHNGLVAWDALPNVSAIEAVEIVRGSASPLYGDAALGAVINVITRPMLGSGMRRARWNLDVDSKGSVATGASLTGLLRGRPASMSTAFDWTEGSRMHSKRGAFRARVSSDVVASPRARITLGAAVHAREFQEPGPLLDSLLARNRDASAVFFRFDDTRDHSIALSTDGDRLLASGRRLSGSVLVEHRDVHAVRTLPLSPDFGDTRQRDAVTNRALATAQFALRDLTLGAEVSRGTLDSRYFAIVTGDAFAYAAADGSRGDQSARGDATRAGAAAFVHYVLEPLSPVRLSLGARADWLYDEFEPRAPTAAQRNTASHAAFSPKAALNYRYAPGAHVYVALSRSFKAPTLDQLFDQRPIPVPFPPFSLTTSNSALEPQHGVSIEGGISHVFRAATPSPLSLSAAVYHMEMKDELDFDVATLRYINIGRSRHRGLEFGLSADRLGPLSFFGNYTLQAATARSGEASGRALKAIPRHALSTGIGLTPGDAFDLRVTATHSREMFLDDDNTRAIPDYTRLDAQLTRRIARFEVVLGARNLLDARYSTTGFLDPSGSGAAYFYPAAGHSFSLGIRSRT
ncbi:MAG TPA: TonB-dependent receptor [Gemmatimonadaceae bacterium]|nr:TonB-dependent receptor [Gemmatimonadaceae bacterium]